MSCFVLVSDHGGLCMVCGDVSILICGDSCQNVICDDSCHHL